MSYRQYPWNHPTLSRCDTAPATRDGSGLTPTDDLQATGIEVVDPVGELLAVLPVQEVRRQSLAYRSVALLLFDPDMRLCLVQIPKDATSYALRWDLSGHAPIYYGQSIQETALACSIAQAPVAQPRHLRVLEEVLAPRPLTGYSFTYLVKAVLPAGCSLPREQTGSIMFVDQEELGYLLQEYRDMFTPMLNLCWERKLLFD